MKCRLATTKKVAFDQPCMEMRCDRLEDMRLGVLAPLRKWRGGDDIVSFELEA